MQKSTNIDWKTALTTVLSICNGGEGNFYEYLYEKDEDRDEEKIELLEEIGITIDNDTKLDTSGLKFFPINYEEVIVTCKNCRYMNKNERELNKYNYITPKTVIISKAKKGAEITLDDLLIAIRSFITKPNNFCDWLATDINYVINDNTPERLVIDITYYNNS